MVFNRMAEWSTTGWLDGVQQVGRMEFNRVVGWSSTGWLGGVLKDGWVGDAQLVHA